MNKRGPDIGGVTMPPASGYDYGKLANVQTTMPVVAIPLRINGLDVDVSVDDCDSVILALVSVPCDDDPGVQFDDIEIAVGGIEDVPPECAAVIGMVSHASNPHARRCHFAPSSIADLCLRQSKTT